MDIREKLRALLNFDEIRKMMWHWLADYKVITKISFHQGIKKDDLYIVIEAPSYNDPYLDDVYEYKKFLVDWNYPNYPRLKKDLSAAIEKNKNIIPFKDKLHCCVKTPGQALPTHRFNREILWEYDTKKVDNGYSDEPIEEIADDAKSYGYIALDELVLVMANEEKYNDLIPGLWTKYQCDKRDSKKPKIHTFKEKFFVWEKLLYRWAYGRVAGTTGGIEEKPPYIPLHSFNKTQGGLEKYNRGAEKSGVAQVKLNDLEKYFTKKIKIPLPDLLFPEDSKLQKSPASNQITDLINKARPEIQTVYEAIKSVGFSSGKSGKSIPSERSWQYTALDKFDRNKGKFKYIKKDYLEDKSVYAFTGGQEKRDFVGRMLQKMIFDRDLGKKSCKNLYNEYKKTDPNRQNYRLNNKTNKIK